MNAIFVAAASIGMSVGAQFLLKSGMKSLGAIQAISGELPIWQAVGAIALDWRIVGGFFLYGLGAVAWLWVLARWDVSKAYPLVGFGFVVTLAVGALLGETVTAIRMIGVVLICAGVYLVARSA